jgi:four helix bundle protein
MKNEIIQRTKQFALDCWKFCFKVPKSREYNAFVNQLIRSSSSVGLIIELHSVQSPQQIL